MELDHHAVVDITGLVHLRDGCVRRSPRVRLALVPIRWRGHEWLYSSSRSSRFPFAMFPPMTGTEFLKTTIGLSTSEVTQMHVAARHPVGVCLG